MWRSAKVVLWRVCVVRERKKEREGEREGEEGRRERERGREGEREERERESVCVGGVRDSLVVYAGMCKSQ